MSFINKLLTIPLLAAALTSNLHIVTTGDVHGSWFRAPYVEGQGVKTSLASVKYYVDSLRAAVGAENVLLLDAGDCLQGDNAAYYYNYVASGEKHLFPRLVSYMGYDAVTVGNHDIETGHPVYDRVKAELGEYGIPFLAANAERNTDGEPYFEPYRVFERGGLKVAVIGLTNPNISAWLSEPVWSGMTFKSLVPLAQEWVDRVRRKERPDVVVVCTHSGTGSGDGASLESQGLDLLSSLKGADVIVCSHDHSPYVEKRGPVVLVNGGARAGHIGHVVINASMRGRRLVSKTVEGEYVRLDKNKVDTEMERRFLSEFNAVKDFTNRRVGELAMELRTRDAYRGMSDYLNLLHTVQLSVPEAQISFAAPLTFDGRVKKGELVFNDMFTIYPYENQMFVLRLRGSEIKNYLEYSYYTWIDPDGEHLLRISGRSDPRTGTERWSFTGRSYNFDSAAGIIYTVDITKPEGSRVEISSMADGSAFDPEAWYNVAMTSYRANGGGEIILKGAGLSKDEIDSRIVARYPEIRDMVYDFIREHGKVDASLTGRREVIGEWKFIPESLAAPLLDKDMGLIF